MTLTPAHRAATLPFRLAAQGLAAPAALKLGAAISLAWLFLALAAPLVAPYDPIAQDLEQTLRHPGWAHWLGTDNFGRDVLSRIIWGARFDLAMGLLGVIVPFILGSAIGLVAGYFGGLVDTLLMRLLDITISFPFFVLVIAIISVLGAGLASFFIAVALVGWVSYARLIRSQTLVLKHSDFVLAARNLGYSRRRIMARHILPNAVLPAVVFSMSDVVLTILLGSSLSYLGLGVQPPAAEWGVMIAEGQTFLATAWWISFFPGLAIVTLALGFSLLADGLAETLGIRE
ncbi:MAG TPA: ABC transporter permease [Hypericibacter adhaerens]|jgi:peptide/nickel transport system permease protein|uniref:Nickel ABC transporter permease n=1 Tax=Hypericibacter adhaerens TaxID=2602016 RepID=A0A5J6MYR6_9PROT|nr:ABC transporter permease [Hypericibacter adhaerens]QEX21735.1 nickel ABC transporter permease [Hypericibacter adhaerens]HWA42461.1 ABC transporter permease [Hypericibacter adhaerens]